MAKKIILLFFLSMLSLASCKESPDFEFNIDYLTGTIWGVPDIIDVNPELTNYNLSAPTVFYKDGKVSIGPDINDFWSKKDSRQIFIQNISEIWFLIELTPETLYVEKSKYPSGDYMMRCIYRPFDAKSE